MDMKKVLCLFFLVFMSLGIMAQEKESLFRTYIYNEEYKVYLDINFYDNDVLVHGQEVFGKVPGYFGAVRDSRKWLITSAEIVGKYSARLEITNDYGSENLTATLTYDPKDCSYTLRQTSGSRLKIVVNRKWQKIPTTLTLVHHERVADGW